MKLLCHTPVLIVLFCLCSCRPVAQGPDSQSKQAWDVKLVEQPKWEFWVAEVHRSSGRGLEKTTGKISRFKLESLRFGKEEHGGFTITAFVTEKGGIWFGPKQNTYFETDAGVVGMTVGGTGIRWFKSVVRNEPRKLSLEEVLERGEKAWLAKLAEPPFTKPERDWDEVTNTSVLNNVVFCPTAEDPIYYCFGSSLGLHTAKVADMHFNGRELRLELIEAKHPDIGIPAKYAATVWIDIRTKQILKVVENGKQPSIFSRN